MDRLEMRRKKKREIRCTEYGVIVNIVLIYEVTNSS